LPNKQAVAPTENQLARHKKAGLKTEKMRHSVFDLRISPLRQCKQGCKKKKRKEKKKEKSLTKYI
jgi:hypothetical protein